MKNYYTLKVQDRMGEIYLLSETKLGHVEKQGVSHFVQMSVIIDQKSYYSFIVG